MEKKISGGCFHFWWVTWDTLNRLILGEVLLKTFCKWSWKCLKLKYIHLLLITENLVLLVYCYHCVWLCIIYNIVSQYFVFSLKHQILSPYVCIRISSSFGFLLWFCFCFLLSKLLSPHSDKENCETMIASSFHIGGQIKRAPQFFLNVFKWISFFFKVYVVITGFKKEMYMNEKN